MPLESYDYFAAHGGVLACTVQLIERPASAHALKSGRATHRLADSHPGELVFGLVSDKEESFAASRAGYVLLRDELALDFGLAAMFATPHRDLLGRGWFAQLRRHDARIDGLARKRQRQGLKPKPLEALPRVAAFRGFLKAEIGQVLNRRVRLKRPAHIVIEKLDFRAPGLSRRLNRILTRSGRAMIREKLNDLGEHFSASPLPR